MTIDEKRSAAPLRLETYSVYARFRRGRLVLMRRLPLGDALLFATKLRRTRFPDASEVFVICDRTGEQVNQPSTEPGQRDAIEHAGSSPAIAVPTQDAPEVGEGRPIFEAAQADFVGDFDDQALYLRAERCMQESRIATRTLTASIARLSGLMEALCQVMPGETLKASVMRRTLAGGGLR